MWKKRFIPYYEDTTSDPLESRSKKPREELQLQQAVPQELVGKSPLPAHQCSTWNHSRVAPSLTMDPPLMNNPVNLMFQQKIEMDLHGRQQAHYQNIRPNMVYGHPTHGLQSGQYENKRHLDQSRALQGADMLADKVDRAAKSSNKDTRDYLKGSNTAFKAIIKNGELVQSEEGHIKVTYSAMAKSTDSSYNSDHINTSTPEAPLNLSMRDQVSQGQKECNPFPAVDNSSSIDVVAKKTTKQEAVRIEAKTCVSPATETFVKVMKSLSNIPVKSTAEDATSKSKYEVPKKSIEASVSVEPTPTSPSNHQNDLKILYPYLKMTNTGSLVLWNFLWALLRDENYNKIVTWVSFSELRFSIVSSTSLASLWGKVKENPNMNWVKIKKILQLYVHKNLLKPGSCEYEFMFLVNPYADEENDSGKK